MTMPVPPAARPELLELPIPRYLEKAYFWDYIHPGSVRLFEREWLINVILLGNYARLRDAAISELGAVVSGTTLQFACVYGNLTACLLERLAPEATLEVVDILPIQLRNLARKLPRDARLTLKQGDTSSLANEDASVDQVLLFFLLHEQPDPIRRKTLAEALRVVKPGGRVVIVDYHRPRRWHPLRPFMRLVFRTLEPYAVDLWTQDMASLLPPAASLASMHTTTYFGGLYQLFVLTRSG